MLPPQSAPATTSVATPYEQLLEQIRYNGAYPTREHAAEVTHAVLAALGRQLTGDERVDLAACLPVEAALTFTAQIPTVRPRTGQQLVQDLAARTGGTPATARWDAGTVLTTIAHRIDPHLLDRILAQLPTGYALLFGRAELLRTA
ncbi:DUF2267 domain-containing protein [Streptomyces sp. NPDC006733]|uniref:DUF2267 domain-containing protein n=1 Tax=Streptomyces sp. NPDC006733 TaxID=3155460 RepID=UPI00340716D6